MIVFEPFYENYGPDAVLAGAKPVFVPLEPPDWRSTRSGCARRSARARSASSSTRRTTRRAACSRATRSTRSRELCLEHDVPWVITDEIYEHILYAGDHHPIATWPGMRERTVTITGLSKTFSCTGWRLGYVIAPPTQTTAIRKVHDFLTVGAPAPLQEAGAVGMAFGADYYDDLAPSTARAATCCAPRSPRRASVQRARGRVLRARRLRRAERRDDTAFALWLRDGGRRRAGAGSSFYRERALGRTLVRFAFCKKRDAEARGGAAGDDRSEVS